MVNNFYITCDVCNCCIRIRYQVSDEKCLINFYCPNCKTQINGSIQTIYHNGMEDIEPFPWHYDLKLNNASRTKKTDDKYVLEISSDFLVNKLIKSEEADVVTPFLRHISLSKKQSNPSRFNNFLLSWNSNWDTLKVNLDLCHNQKYDLLFPRLTAKYETLPDDINAIMLTHQSLIKFCIKILPKNILHEYSKMNNKLIKLIQENRNETNLFFNIYNIETIKESERKLLQMVKSFLDIYPKFIPVFNSLSYPDKTDLRLSTLTFEDIKSFYQDTYELILFLLPQIIGLNNISNRKELNNFLTGKFDFSNKINSYNSKYKIYEELLNENDKFSWLINSDIKNHIRNSIGHFNYKVDNDNQSIQFIDNHKGKDSIIELSLINIAKNCIYMFYTLINLLELNYDLLKIVIIFENAPKP